MKQTIVMILLLLISACHRGQKTAPTHPAIIVMQQHLQAVSERNLEVLKLTLAPTGQMQLILPQSEIIGGTDAFLAYHKNWFAIPDWTFETHILNTLVKRDMAMAVVEVIYREPERDGKPYVNRMIVSYVLQRVEGQWYVIKDHASSIEKSTD
ncbi:YybH family protein [Marinicella sediminis]|uniref:YybH family protein n=1 Tax=Marinicella sediminis TaxID=1792834 RepID=A0ABV7J748_9GAMM|nr:nuclear transport factor 2 family protein [Marinicella sediminis]